jgi:hypothetical protein
VMKRATGPENGQVVNLMYFCQEMGKLKRTQEVDMISEECHEKGASKGICDDFFFESQEGWLEDPLNYRCVLHRHEKEETFIMKQKNNGIGSLKQHIKLVHHFVPLNDDKKDDLKEPSKKKINTGGGAMGKFLVPKNAPSKNTTTKRAWICCFWCLLKSNWM